MYVYINGEMNSFYMNFGLDELRFKSILYLKLAKRACIIFSALKQSLLCEDVDCSVHN